MNKILVRELIASSEAVVVGTIKTAAFTEVRRNNKQNRDVVLMMYEVETEEGLVHVVEKRNSFDAAVLKEKYYTVGRKVEVKGTIMTWWYPELKATFTNLYGYGRLV